MKEELIRFSQDKKHKKKNDEKYDPPRLIRYGNLKELTECVLGGLRDVMTNQPGS